MAAKKKQTIKAVLDGVEFEAVYQGDIPVCPTCGRRVPARGIVDEDRAEELKEKANKVLSKEKESFTRALRSLNSKLAQVGGKELSPKQLAKMLVESAEAEPEEIEEEGDEGEEEEEEDDE